MADDFLPPGYIPRLFQIESGGNPNARTGSYRGLGQFGPREEATYGINDANRGDAAVQAAAVAKEAAANRSRLRSVLGREPTSSDYYLAHQQGGAGAAALFGNPATPAWQAIRPFYKSDEAAQRAILGNIPTGSALSGVHPDKISSADFAGLWAGKFDKSAPVANLVASAQPAASPVSGFGAIPGLTGAAPAPTAASGAPAAAAMAQATPSAFSFLPPPPPLPTGPLRPIPLAPRRLV